MRFTKSIIVSLTILFSFLYTQEVVMGLGSYDGSSAEVTMDTPFDVGGFQFNVVGANVSSGSGGLAAQAGFIISTGGETVLGFSFTGSTIPANSSGVLTNLSGTFPEEACLDLGTGAVSDGSGQALDVIILSQCEDPCDDLDADGICDDVDDCVGEFDECGVCNGDGIADGACDCDGNVEDCAGECGGDAVVDECGVCDGDGSSCQIIVSLGFGAVGDASMEITMDTPADVAGFQMTVTGTQLGEASGGLAADAGFTVSCGENTGICLGFAFDGSVIPAGSNGVLTNLEYVATASETCLENVLVTDSNVNNLEVSVGGCVELDFECTDADADGICDDVDDCVGEIDECGVCNGDGSSCQEPVYIAFGAVGDTSMELTMDTPVDVGGFQLDILGTDLGDAFGGLAADAGFTVSTGGTTMLGFSFTGSVIPAGSNGVLTNVEYVATASEACLANGVISDGLGNGVDVELSGCVDIIFECTDADSDGICDDVDDCVGEYDDCGVCNGDNTSCLPNLLSFGLYDNDTLEILYSSNSDIGGFQFEVSGVNVINTYGGAAEEAGFTVSSGNGIVLGFSFEGNVIPAGEGSLLKLEIEVLAEESCISGIVISDPDGEPVNFEAGDCIELDYECVDEDADGICDDVDDCVGEYDCAGECGGDAIIDDCGVCNGNNEDQDCSGECFGDAIEDECGVCEGDNSSCTGCTDESANNYDSDAIVDDGSCNFDYYYSDLEETGVSQAVIFSEEISLEVGDEIGIYDSNALISDGDCTDEYGELLVGRGTWTGEQLNTVAISSINYCNFDDGYQLPGFVEGNPIVIRVWDASEGVEYDTIFDITAGSYDFEETSFVVVSDLEFAVYGCIDESACNFDSDANVDNGSCTYAEDNFDCDGNCVVEEDCFGECGGEAYIDECGDCVIGESDCVTEVTNLFDLQTNWNWISFNVYQDDMSIGNVFNAIDNPDNLNFIKSQLDGTSTWYEGFGWFGSLETLSPTKGYQLKMNNPDVLVYPDVDPIVSVIDDNIESSDTFERNNLDLLGWDLNAYDYEFNGAITFEVNNSNDSDILATFVDGEVRGIAERLYFPYGDKYIYIMQVYSNEVEGEELSFKLYNSISGEVSEYVESIVFENDMIIGDGFATFNLENTVDDVIVPTESSLSNAYPNPFNPATSLDYGLSVDGNVSITVYDISGQVVEILVDDYKYAGEYSLTWNAQNYSSGIYFIGMEANGSYFTQKLMLVK